MTEHKINRNIAKLFRNAMYSWSLTHPRPMPWKGEKDPYKIWISEIILQQTRVEQGWDYFNRFIKTFPTITSLAKAPISRVLKMWEGLGYYSRARNLHYSAQYIQDSYDSQFPDRYDDILKLKGIGQYTAAAIASFAFNLPYAVLDGNVHRILSRYFGIDSQMQSSQEKKYFQALANQLLDNKSPGKYNQAIMDFGAMCCTPGKPSCTICPLQKKCNAFLTDRVSILPPVKKKVIKKTRHFHYFIFVDKNKRISIQQRHKQDIWKGLFEFPMVESKHTNYPEKSILKIYPWMQDYPFKKLVSKKQILSHQVVHMHFYQVAVKALPDHFEKTELTQLNKLAMPIGIAQLRDSLISLVLKSD